LDPIVMLNQAQMLFKQQAPYQRWLSGVVHCNQVSSCFLRCWTSHHTLKDEPIKEFETVTASVLGLRNKQEVPPLRCVLCCCWCQNRQKITDPKR
jgi:hypothetical protein